jgi:integrase
MRVFKQKYRDRQGKLKDSAKWYVEFKDHTETVRRIPGFTDKKITEELGRRIEKLVALRVMGNAPDPDLARWLESLPNELRDKLTKHSLLDSRTVAGGKPLAEHLDDFHASLLHKGDTEVHSDIVKARVSNLLRDCRFKFYGDISASKVQATLSQMRNNGDGLSIQTSNYYLQSIKHFCNWMVSDGRASEKPLMHLTGMNAKVDLRRERRSLSGTELKKLLKATANSPGHHNLDGRARAMLYRVAMETGLRRKELSALTPESFDFDSATVTLAASNSKNRKPTVLPIRSELVDELKMWVKTAQIAPERLLWPNLTKRTSDMVKRDLEAVGIPYVDEAGLYADFHALRHSYISLITQGGVHPKIAQRLARHSDINLTMSRYSHTLLSDEAEALEVLPDFPSVFDTDRPQQQTLQATGTDDGQLTSSRPDTPERISPHACTREESVLPLCLPEKGTSEVNSVHLSASNTDDVGEDRRMKKTYKPGEKPGNIKVPEAGIEPARPLRTLDFESSASAIPPLRLDANKLPHFIEFGNALTTFGLPIQVAWLQFGHLKQMRCLRAEKTFKADFLARYGIGYGASFSQFEIGIGPGDGRFLPFLFDCDIDHHCFRGRLAQLGTAFPFDVLFRRDAGVLQRLHGFFDVVHRLDLM